jgi:predicted CoA-binding protein
LCGFFTFKVQNLPDLIFLRMERQMTTTKADVNDFVAQKTLAVVGASRSPQKFGNMAYKELRERGYKLYPVHPKAETIEGDPAYPSLSALPEEVGGVLVVVPPMQTEQIVKDAAAAGIKRVWLQQGAESEEAIKFCEENGISVVHGHCIMMFMPNTASFHKFHRWVWGLLGKLPN